MSHTACIFEPKTNIPLHKDIRFHPELNWGEKLFLAEIDAMSKKGRCPFSSRKLGEIFGVSHQTILNWVKKLVEMDLLEVGIDYKNPDCKQFLKTKNRD